jgi:predicted ATPase
MDYNAWNIVKKDIIVRNKVNKWLGGENSKLKTGYELSVKKYLDPKDYFRSLLNIIANPSTYEKDLKDIFELDDEQFYDYLDDFINKLLEEYDISKENKLIEYIANKFSKQTIEELIIKDLRTDTTVSHRDIGVGISQVLPVLVSAYASKNAIIAIEQPELHLHPALQSEIADVFIETALKENNNTYLIETHSEHLLLRIMRRIRETANKELAEGITPITPDDVQILFVLPDEENKESIIKKISLRKNGELKDRWPGGFFEESFNEIF